MLAIYTLTIFVSAVLLFLIQPMFARMVLPMLGGAPAVWNTAVVFYQVLLLAGYIYAHVSTKWLGVRRQAMLHAALLLLPLLVLPIGVPPGWSPPTESNPIPWLLALLLVAVGLPFFVVTTSSPLIQQWFAHTGHRMAADPYFLYAASNLGSVLALLGYPLLMEPALLLQQQSWLWAGVYGLLVVLTWTCAAILWRSTAPSIQPTLPPVTPQPAALCAEAGDTLTIGRRVRWVLLAFVPSSLMLSVTNYLSTNIATIPLLWIIPLVLYLLTFILVFARKPPIPHKIMVRALPIVLLPLVIVIAAQATHPIWILLPLHLMTYFIATLVSHGELANDRPSTRHLTEFYLWLSFGGALGGMFTALLAPLIFTQIVEYPLMLVAACLVTWRPGQDQSTLRSRVLDVGLPLALGGIVVGCILALQAGALRYDPLSLALIFGLPAFICFSFSRRPVRFSLGIAAILLAATLYSTSQGRVVFTERSFFGIHRILVDRGEHYHMLVHGGTMHGMQSRDPARSREPLSYYYASGPIGQVFAEFNAQDAQQHVAVVGLGVGSIACYSQPGQQWTFYEIDPVVEQIARDTRYFTFLAHCAPDASVVLGDARLALAHAADQQYDLIILDAYSSDSIPLHLITRESLALYLDKLAPDGILAFHISNNYFDLKPVLGNMAQNAGLVALVQDDLALTAEEQAQGKSPSEWVVMVRDGTDLGNLAADSRWSRLYGQPTIAMWTDDYASLLSVVRW